jgi:hypothetical protein
MLWSIRFEVLMMYKIHAVVFWVMMLCNLIGGYSCFGGIWCLNLQGYSEPSWNVTSYIEVYIFNCINRMLSNYSIQTASLLPRKMCNFFWLVKDDLDLKTPCMYSLSCECRTGWSFYWDKHQRAPSAYPSSPTR